MKHLSEVNRVIKLVDLNKQFTTLLAGRDFKDLSEEEHRSIYWHTIFRKAENTLIKEYKNSNVCKEFYHSHHATFGSVEDGYPKRLDKVITFENLDYKGTDWCVCLIVENNELKLTSANAPLSVQATQIKHQQQMHQEDVEAHSSGGWF